VTLAETGLTSGTGARLRLVRDYIDTDTFMYTYGDGIGSVDIASLLECHRSHDRIGTVTGVPSDLALRRDAGSRATPWPSSTRSRPVRQGS
jgi:NDP-sugar pyrophosphorylase family protein